MKLGRNLKALVITDRTYLKTYNKHRQYFIVCAFVLALSMISNFAFAEASIMGLSGTMLVPDLETMENGGARAAIHMTGTSDFDEATFKGVFAFSDDSEVAIIKRFAISGVSDQTDPLFAGKYKVRPNLAVAAIIDPNEGYKDSVMMLTGTPGNKVVLGLGANIAMDDNDKKAVFGRYDTKGVEADPVFFVLGAKLNVTPDTKLTIDYAGNDFCVGARHNFDETTTLDFGYLTPDRIHSEGRYLFGVDFGF